MSFMQPQVYETDYLEIDGPMGTEIVPCDVADLSKEEIEAWDDCEDDRAIPGPLAMYCENNWAYTIERKHGWLGRLSAPGYMDATDWTSGKSEADVRAQLADLYGDDEDMSAEEPITSDEHASMERAERNREEH